MPKLRAGVRRKAHDDHEQEAVDNKVKTAGLEPGAEEPVAMGRPYQDHVENEAGKYWLEMVDTGKLVKPAQQELRDAAMPILCGALRRRTREQRRARAHLAVTAMQMHLAGKGKLKDDYTHSSESPDYIEALVQLADDLIEPPLAVPLPAHPGPQHPKMFYTKDESRNLIPARNSRLQASYVRNPDDSRVFKGKYFHPCEELPMSIGKGEGCYSLEFSMRRGAEIRLYWDGSTDRDDEVLPMKYFLRFFEFRPPRLLMQQPGPEPGEGEPMDTGQPRQDSLVESRLSRYLQRYNICKPVKPTRQELRDAALPILCRARQRRVNWPRYLEAVNIMRQNALERGEIKKPVSVRGECRNYIDALIRLADDTGKLAREIPLPAHPGPRHPPIYYMTDEESGLPVPREKDLMDAKYVRLADRKRVTRNEYIRPWTNPSVDPTEFMKKGDAYYRLAPDREGKGVVVFICYDAPLRYRVLYQYSRNLDEPQLVEHPLGEEPLCELTFLPRQMF